MYHNLFSPSLIDEYFFYVQFPPHYKQCNNKYLELLKYVLVDKNFHVKVRTIGRLFSNPFP